MRTTYNMCRPKTRATTFINVSLVAAVALPRDCSLCAAAVCNNKTHTQEVLKSGGSTSKLAQKQHAVDLNIRVTLQKTHGCSCCCPLGRRSLAGPLLLNKLLLLLLLLQKMLLLLLAQLPLTRLRNSCCSLPLLQRRCSDDRGRTTATDAVAPGGSGHCRKTSGGERGVSRGSAGNRRRRHRCCGRDRGGGGRGRGGLQQSLLLKLLLLLLLEEEGLLLLLLLLKERVLLLLLLQERLVLLLLLRRGLQGLYGSLL